MTYKDILKKIDGFGGRTAKKLKRKKGKSKVKVISSSKILKQFAVGDKF